MEKTLRLLLLLFLFAIIHNNLYGQTIENIVIGQKMIIHSDCLNQDWEILISLPKSYNDTIYKQQNYPVLYLLDAQEHFDLATGIVGFMGSRLDSKLIPELIIVGVISKDRIADFTPTNSTRNPEGIEVESFKKSGGADHFLSFLQHELMPTIDGKYRTIPFSILVGHSLGGLFSIYDGISRNSVFNAQIAMDPSLWWDNDLLFKRVKSDASSHLDAKVLKLYISGAHNSSSSKDTTAMRKSQLIFYEALKSRINRTSRVAYRIFENEDHGMVPLPSIYHGLQFIFGNYRMNNMLGASAEEIQEHFLRISDSIGIKLLPSERVIDIIGSYYANSREEAKKGISLLELNTMNYPKSYHAYHSLGKAYLSNGDSARAIINYRKSLELKPNNKILLQDLQAVMDQ